MNKPETKDAIWAVKETATGPGAHSEGYAGMPYATKYIRADLSRELIEKAYRQGWRDNDEHNNPEVGAPFGLPQSEDEGVEEFFDENGLKK